MSKNYKKIIINLSLISIITFFLIIWCSNKFFGGTPLYARFLISPYQDTLRIYYNNYHDLYNDYNYSEYEEYSKRNNNLFIYPCRESKKKFLVFVKDKNNFKSNFDTYDVNNILIGDSVLFGHCVKYKDGITGLLREKTGDSFLELAEMGTSIDNQLFWLKKYVNKNNNFQNLVIFFYEGDDLIFNRKITTEKKLVGEKFSLKKIKEYENLYKNDHDKKITINQKIRFILAEQLRGISSFVKHIIFYKKNNDEKEIIKYFDYINDLKDYYQEKKNRNISIVYLPGWKRFNYPEWHNKYKYYDSIFTQLKKHSTKANINLIDCRKSIGNDKKLIFTQKYFQHYNELGYLKIANCYLDNFR